MVLNENTFDLTQSDISSIAIAIADLVYNPKAIERERIPSRILVHGHNAHLEEIASGVQHLLTDYTVESRNDYSRAEEGVFSLNADYFISRYFSNKSTRECAERYD